MTATSSKAPALLPVLVATKETQGQRTNDFCWCDEDEPVRFGTECDGEHVDGKCGCRRSMTGMLTLKGTTTIRVKHLQISREEFASMLQSSYEKSVGSLAAQFKDILNEGLEEEVDQLLDLAASFRVSAVLEKRGNTLQVRTALPTP